MDQTDAATSIAAVVIVVAAFLLPILAAASLVWFFLARRRRERVRLAAMSPEERALHDRSLVAVAELKAAEAAHQRAYAAYQSGVASAEAALKAAEEVGSRLLTQFNGRDSSILLYEDRIGWAPAGGQWTFFPMDNQVRATVDSSGNVYSTERSTAGRMIAGGVLLGGAGLVAGAAARKTDVHDSRELYLQVEGTNFSMVVTCPPDQGAYVRQLASYIVNTGHQVETLKLQRPAAVKAAQDQLELAKSATRENQAASDAAEAARANVAQIEAAKSRLTLTSERDVPPTRSP